MRANLETRFHAKVYPEPNSGCWLWDGCIDTKGYGVIRGDDMKHLRAHRVSYELYRGPVPDGHGVLHRCDVPGCVNPMHLFTGTNGDNNRDRTAKGRSARGERHGSRTKPERVPRGERHSSKTQPASVRRGERNGSAKLSDADVMDIRSRYASGGISQYQLAREYRVTQANVSSIILRKTRVMP